MELSDELASGNREVIDEDTDLVDVRGVLAAVGGVITPGSESVVLVLQR